MARRWICGWAVNHFGERQAENAAWTSICAARIPAQRDPTLGPLAGAPFQEGNGFPHRMTAGVGTTGRTSIDSDYAGTGRTTAMYESAWFRLRRKTRTSEDPFYSSLWTKSPGGAMMLTCDSAGLVRVYNRGAGGYPGTLIGGLTTLPLNSWVRLACGSSYTVTASLTNPGFFDISQWLAVYAFAQASVTSTNPTGLIASQTPWLFWTFNNSSFVGITLNSSFHSRSVVGLQDSVGGNGLEIDVADWWGDDTASTFGGIQVATGGLSDGPILLCRPTALGMYQDWLGGVPDYRLRAPARKSVVGASDPTGVSSAVGGARYSVNCGTLLAAGLANATDIVSAIQITAWLSGALVDLTNAMIVRIDGVETTYTPFGFGGGLAPSILIDNPPIIVLGVPTRLILPTSTIEIGFQRDVGISKTLKALWLTVQTCATNQTTGVSKPKFYPTAAQIQGSVVDDTIRVNWGTYVGNDTLQFISAGFSAHWISVFRISIFNSMGTVWWDTKMGAAQHDNGINTPGFIPLVTDTGFYVGGTDSNINAAGFTYAWVAIRDPRRRALTRGAFVHADGDAVGADISSNVIDPVGFAPGFQWGVTEHTTSGGTWYVQRDDLPAGGSSIRVRDGTLQGGNTFLPINGAAAFQTGVNFQQASTVGIDGVAYTQWRYDRFTANQLWNGLLYVGTGGARTVTIDLHGGTPIWLLVVPTNGDAGVVRTHAHTSTNSIRLNGGAQFATGITALGSNSFSVDPAYNLSGVTYLVHAVSNGLGSPASPPVDPPAPTNPPEPTPDDPPSPPGTACLEPAFLN